MANGNDQTPQDGTGDAQTPAAGTDIVQQTGVEPQAPPDIDYKTKFAESTREAQRLFQQNQQLSQTVQQMQWQMQQLSQRQQPAPTPEPRQDEASLYAEMADGVLDRDPGKIGKFVARIRNSVKDEIVQDLTAAGTRQQRINTSLDFVRKELSTNPTLAQKAIQRYQQIANDYTYTAMVQPDTIDFNGLQVNPHLLRQAVLEEKANLGTAGTRIMEQARVEADGFTEPSQPPQKKTGTKFDPMKHLSAEERATADRQGMSYERYWKYLDDPRKRVKLTEERLKTGKPVTYRQLGIA